MIVIASDHAGYELKEKLIQYFKDEHIEVRDLGTYSLDSVDYPDYGIKIGHEVVKNTYEMGIAICGTGIGISISANKVKGVRAALIYDEQTARLAKKHNNANIIALGGRTTTFEDAIKMIEAFRSESFEERHQKRIDKINEYEV